MLILRSVVSEVGGVRCAAEMCGVSQRAVYKWLASGSLPRTEYTGETDYAETLSAHEKVLYSATELRDLLKPGRQSA